MIALNGLPVAAASNPTPPDRTTVLSEWATALGMRSLLTEPEAFVTIDYDGTGTIAVSGEPCRLTTYRMRVNYKVAGSRQEFSCLDAQGQAHREIHVVSGRFAWNETETGLKTVSAMGTRTERLLQLWSDPVALVKAAVAAGAATQITVESGRTVVRFPVPGVKGATATAILSGRHQAERVETRLGDIVIKTTYSDYAPLSQPDGREVVFPRRIVQTEGAVTLADLRIANPTNQNDAAVAAPVAEAAPIAPDATREKARRRPATWANEAWAKLDESLRGGVAGGCIGPQSVIIRTKAGYRAGLRESLTAHGNQLSGEFSLINAVGARVSCEDLATLAGFSSTLSVSVNAPVATADADQLPSVPPVNLPSVPPAPAPEVASAPAPAPEVTPAPAPEVASAPAPAPEVTPVPAPEVASAPAPEVPSPPTVEAQGHAAALLQTPMLRTLLGDAIDQLRSAAPTNGSIGVAVIDSGIAPGIDFGDRITAFYDFTQGDVLATEPSDEYGHGTHVAGLVGSRFVGVAPQARLIGLKVLDHRGQGESLNVLRAIEFAAMNKDALDIQILNVSLGHPIYEPAASDPLVQAVESAVRMGLVVVVSAGNFGLNAGAGEPSYAGIASPGNAPSALTIGAVRTFNTATRDDDRIGDFSSRGPSWYDGFVKPDFSAPGQNLLSVATPGSTLRATQEALGNTGNYMRLTGTSMAAGVVSGLAALVLQANRGLTPNALKVVLEYSAINMATENFLTQGAGAVSGGAVALAQAIDSSVPVGEKWLVAGVTPETVIDGVAQPWVQRMLWGSRVARGTGVIDEQRPAWATAMAWGYGLEDSNQVWTDDDNVVVWATSVDDPTIVSGSSLDNIVWGNNIVWADNDNIVWGDTADDNIVWGNNIVWGDTADDNIVWGNDDNIVWGNNIVWGDSLIGYGADDNIVWGNSIADDNIVWGNLSDDNIVWGNLSDDNIVWGNAHDNKVWGNSVDNAGVTPAVNTNGNYIRARRTVKGGR